MHNQCPAAVHSHHIAIAPPAAVAGSNTQEAGKAVHRCIQLTPALMVRRLFFYHALTSPLCIFHLQA